jgi:hypothetical protein
VRKNLLLLFSVSLSEHNSLTWMKCCAKPWFMNESWMWDDAGNLSQFVARVHRVQGQELAAGLHLLGQSFKQTSRQNETWNYSKTENKWLNIEIIRIFTNIKQELLGQFSSTVEQKLHHWEWKYNDEIFLT